MNKRELRKRDWLLKQLRTATKLKPVELKSTAGAALSYIADLETEVDYQERQLDLFYEHVASIDATLQCLMDGVLKNQKRRRDMIDAKKKKVANRPPRVPATIEKTPKRLH